VSAPYRGAVDDVDLDRTLDVLAERRPMAAQDIVMRERRRVRRAVALLVDVSGSMRGERIRTAAAAVGALAATLTRDDLAVVAFWSDAAMVLSLGDRAPGDVLIDRVLSIRASGLTNLEFPLAVAADELRGVPDGEARVVLLSDCVHNAGEDPRRVAAALPRLDVLFDVSGERDEELARDLARLGRGLVLPVREYRDVAPALSRAFAA